MCRLCNGTGVFNICPGSCFLVLYRLFCFFFIWHVSLQLRIAFLYIVGNNMPCYARFYLILLSLVIISRAGRIVYDILDCAENSKVNYAISQSNRFSYLLPSLYISVHSGSLAVLISLAPNFSHTRREARLFTLFDILRVFIP